MRKWTVASIPAPVKTQAQTVAGLAPAGVRALVAACCGVLLACGGGRCFALEAAGAFKGGSIEGVATFVDKLQGNLVWLGGTGMGLVIAVVAILFLAGHSRAHDIALKTILGLAILASLGGIVA